jgi:hypothetical protein
MNLNIPVSPGTVYKNSGWIGMGDWLGTGFVAHKLKEFLSFEIAKKKVVKLRLKGLQDWRHYCISGEKPNNIPSNPEKIYNESGWAGYGDWLGTGNIQPGSITYLVFEEARKFVRNLKLFSRKEWDDYCNSGDKPNNIPNAPHHTYKSKGWIGMGDWLGTGRVATKDIIYRDFKSARSYLRKLNFKTQNEWNQFCKSGKKPIDIPRNADRTYKNLGWKGWSDFLGKETKK